MLRGTLTLFRSGAGKHILELIGVLPWGVMAEITGRMKVSHVSDMA